MPFFAKAEKRTEIDVLTRYAHPFCNTATHLERRTPRSSRPPLVGNMVLPLRRHRLYLPCSSGQKRNKSRLYVSSTPVRDQADLLLLLLAHFPTPKLLRLK